MNIQLILNIRKYMLFGNKVFIFQVNQLTFLLNISS